MTQKTAEEILWEMREHDFSIYEEWATNPIKTVSLTHIGFGTPGNHHIRNGMDICLTLLGERKSDFIASKSNRQQTPLMICCSSLSCDAAQTIINHGADPKEENSVGQTVWHTLGNTRPSEHLKRNLRFPQTPEWGTPLGRNTINELIARLDKQTTDFTYWEDVLGFFTQKPDNLRRTPCDNAFRIQNDAFINFVAKQHGTPNFGISHSQEHVQAFFVGSGGIPRDKTLDDVSHKWLTELFKSCQNISPQSQGLIFSGICIRNPHLTDFIYDNLPYSKRVDADTFLKTYQKVKNNMSKKQGENFSDEEISSVSNLLSKLSGNHTPSFSAITNLSLRAKLESGFLKSEYAQEDRRGSRKTI